MSGGRGIILIATVVLGGCAFAPSHKGDPQTCRERVAYKLATNYPDPNNLKVAIDTVCEGGTILGPPPPTTTRPP